MLLRAADGVFDLGRGIDGKYVPRDFIFPLEVVVDQVRVDGILVVVDFLLLPAVGERLAFIEALGHSIRSARCCTSAKAKRPTPRSVDGWQFDNFVVRVKCGGGVGGER